MLKAVLFDLDGTLLPMDEDKFTKGYFKLLSEYLYPMGYDKEKLIENVWAGTKCMLKNDGTHTNEEVFWNYFASIYGKNKLKNKDDFDNFYITDFKKTKVFCRDNIFAKEIINSIRELGLKTILVSNPVFPLNGMLTRLSFVNLKANDFDYITSYESSHYCKPNRKFYEEVLRINNLKPDEVIYFGNSEVEDYLPATSCNIQTYLVGNCTNISDLSNIKVINYKDILKIINSRL